MNTTTEIPIEEVNRIWFERGKAPAVFTPPPAPQLTWKCLDHGYVALMEDDAPWRVIRNSRPCPEFRPLYIVSQVKDWHNSDGVLELKYLLHELKTSVLAKAVAHVKDRCSIHGGTVPDLPVGVKL